MGSNCLMPINGYCRIDDILKLIPIGRSTWWLGVKEGRFPKPVKIGPKITAWRVNDINALIERISSQQE